MYSALTFSYGTNAVTASKGGLSYLCHSMLHTGGTSQHMGKQSDLKLLRAGEPKARSLASWGPRCTPGGKLPRKHQLTGVPVPSKVSLDAASFH